MKKLNILVIIITAICSLTCSEIQGKSVSVRGIVLDQDGQPLKETMIFAKDRDKTKTVNSRGLYRIRTKVGGTLVYLCAGYKTKEYVVGLINNPLVTITMQKDSEKRSK